MNSVVKCEPPNQRKISVNTPTGNLLLLDVSETYRPEISNTNFRQFVPSENDPIMKRVYNHYRTMHRSQTVDFVRAKQLEYKSLDKVALPVMEALEHLSKFIDESDPDISLPNIVHAFQTAETIRKMHPEEDWLHLTGLIHDLGKILSMWGEPQWAIAGDTYPVGCKVQPSVVYANDSFEGNPDIVDPKYSTKYGMYEPGCGLDKLEMAWGHDEYMYRVLKGHKDCRLPSEALQIIRFHSFYPWHTGGDYWHFANDADRQLYYWIREFNKFDLYTKSDDVPKFDELKPYYQQLVDKYIPGVLHF